MFELNFEIKESDFAPIKIEFEKKNDIIKKPEVYKSVKRFGLADIYDKVNFGITIFKYLPELEDFIVVYSNDRFWDYFIAGYHEDINGRLLSEILPEMHKFYPFELFKEDYNDFKLDALMKLYKDGDLVKSWSQINTLQDDLLYSCNIDLTDYYLEKLKRETIFKNSDYPLLNIDKDLNVIKINPTLEEFLGYSLKDLRDYNQIVYVNELSEDEKLTIYEVLNEVFKENIESKNIELILKAKDSTKHKVRAHITRVNDEYVQIAIHDKSALIESESNAVRMQDYLDEIQDISKTAINLYDENGYFWTDKIFDLLEIPLEDREYSSTDFFIDDYITPESSRSIEEEIEKLTLTNPIELEFDMITPKGNHKYFKVYMKLLKQNDKIFRLTITQDITEEKLEELDKLRLVNSFEAVQSSSKLVIVESDGEDFYFTDEIYNLLEINPEDYKGVNVIREFVFPEDKKILKQAWDDASEENPFYELSFRAKSSKGKILYFELNANLSFKDGEFLGFAAFIQDITEEKLAKSEALRLQESFNSLGDFSKMMIGSYQEGRYTWTPEIYKILKIRPEDYSDTVNVLRIFSAKDDTKKVENALLNLSPENNTFSYIAHVYDSTGNLHYFNSFTVVNFNDDGEVKSHDFLIQDVTDEILAKEEALRLQESVNALGDFSKITIGYYANGKFTWTPEIYNILKIRPEDYSDTVNVFRIFSRENDVEIVNKLLNNLSPENNTYSYISHVYDSTGDLHYLNTYTVANFEDNEIISYYLLVHDVTEQTLAKNEALGLQESINTLGDFCKITIGSSQNGKFTWTPEAYNLLKIHPDDYPNNISIMEEFSSNQDVREMKELIGNATPENNSFYHLSNIHDNEGNLHYFNSFTIVNFEKDELISKDFFVQDVTEETLAKKEALRLQEGINNLGDFSKIAIGSYENGKMTWTPEVYNILKIKPEDYDDTVNVFRIFSSEKDNKEMNDLIINLSPENNTFAHLSTVYDNEGNLHYINSFTVANFDNKGNMLSDDFIIQDITDEILAKKSAIDLQESLSTIQDISKIVVCNYVDGEYNWTNGIYHILEINPKDYDEHTDFLNEFIIKSEGSFKNLLDPDFTPEHSSFHSLLTIQTINGNIKILDTYLKAKFDDESNLTNITGFLQEATKRVNYQRNLEHLSEDRKVLLQEVHHRVKNNLQIILSFLSIESRYHNDEPEYVIEQTRNRIQTMALTHEEVYNSEDFVNIDLNHFIINAMEKLFRLYSNDKINQNLNIEHIMLDMNKSIPLSLLINEFALNTIKYAFPNQNEREFSIDAKSYGETIVIKMWDNGIGLPDGVDLFTSDSLGFIIINNLSRQLDADLKVLNDVEGFGIQLTFKK